MYEPAPGSYFYPGSKVMRNVPGLRDARALAQFEAAMTAQRSDEPLPGGRLSASHYRHIHRHLFQDVYFWAGRYRTVRISKGNSHFCYPENIEGEMSRLFQGLPRRIAACRSRKPDFAQTAAYFLSQLNAIHPFREGNGRTMRAFIVVAGRRAGHKIAIQRIDKDAWMEASKESFRKGDTTKMRTVIASLIVP